jgi:hypothetical protein
MNIRREWASNTISINIEVGDRGTFSGTLINQGGTFQISRLVIVKGRKCTPFTYKGKPAYQVLPDAIYDEIDTALRDSFRATIEEELEGRIEVAKREYHKALNIGPVEANKWLDEWNSLAKKLQRLAK